MWAKLNTMKHFITLVACFASFIALAQNPNYDPDSNGDDLIGAEDLVSLLGVYNTSLAVDTALECDFDGTAEDEWLFGIFSDDVVIDSVVIQYIISDSATYFEPGCPVEQVYYLDVEMEYTAYPQLDTQTETFQRVITYYNTPWGTDSWGLLNFFFDGDMGRAYFQWTDDNLIKLKNNGAPYGAEFNFPTVSGALWACTNAPSYYQTFSLTEEGIVGGTECLGTAYTSSMNPWNSDHYTYFRILPYWHYAE